MKITTKTTLILSFMITLFIVSDIVIQKHFILPEFLELEEQHAQNNVARVESLIDQTIKQVDYITYDWSAWDDSYTFIQNPNNEYVSSNLAQGTLDNLRVDFILLLNQNNELVFGQTKENNSLIEEERTEQLKSTRLEKSDVLVKTAIDKIQPFLSRIDETQDSDLQFVRGILLMEDKPLIFSVRPILDSEGQGPRKGFFIIGKYINAAFKETIKAQLNIDFTLEGIDSPEQNIPSTSSTSDYQFKRQNNDTLEVSKIIFSQEQPVLKIHTYSPRDISKNAIENINFALLSMLISGVSGILLVWLLLKINILKPISDLTNSILKLSTSKDYSFRVDHKRADEIGALAKEFNHLLSIIEKNNADLSSAYSLIKIDNERIKNVSMELKEANKELKRLSVTDALTGIANRLCFEQKLKNDWNALIRPREPLSILMVDIDYFKLYNDHYGHQEGDKCLIKVAAILEQCARRPSDMAARYGGEEFIIILPKLDLEAAKNVAENIQFSIAEAKIENQASKVSDIVTVSIGISSIIPSHNTSIESLIKNADTALYQAKKSGRAHYQCLVQSA